MRTQGQGALAAPTASKATPRLRDPLGWRAPLADFLSAIHGEVASKTQQFYAQRLGLLARWAEETAEEGQGIEITDFKARHMRRFMADRADALGPTGKPLSNSTRRSDAIAAKVFFKFCHAESHIAQNPLADYKILKAERAFVPKPTDEEGACLLRACVDRWNPIKNPDAAFFSKARRTFFARRNFAVLATLMQTGMRPGEAFALTRADFRADERILTVRKSKGKDHRTLPLEDVLVTILEDFLLVRPRLCPTDFLFVTDAGTQMSVESFRRRWYNDLAFSGLPHYSLYSLRHYSLTCLAEVNIFAASQIAGHKSVKVTRGYAHGSGDHLRSVMEEAAPLSKLLVNSRSQAEKKRRAKLV